MVDVDEDKDKEKNKIHQGRFSTSSFHVPQAFAAFFKLFFCNYYYLEIVQVPSRVGSAVSSKHSSFLYFFLFGFSSVFIRSRKNTKKRTLFIQPVPGTWLSWLGGMCPSKTPCRTYKQCMRRKRRIGLQTDCNPYYDQSMSRTTFEGSGARLIMCFNNPLTAAKENYIDFLLAFDILLLQFQVS